MSELAKQASAECRREFEAACRLTVPPKVLKQFEGMFTTNFERKCTDNEAGLKYWASVGQQMRDNARYIGTFAEYFAKDSNPPAVGLDHLGIALIVVRACCLSLQERELMSARKERGDQPVRPRFEICRDVKVDSEIADAFDAFLLTVGGQRKRGR